MKILHITDLHYTNQIGGRTKQQKLIEKFLNDIKENALEIDYVIFSGDLVNDGSNIKDFDIACTEFLVKTLENLNVKKDNLFICPGNHDVDRSIISNSVLKYLDEEIDDNDKLNSFFRNDNPDLETSHKPLYNYRNFIEKYFNKENDNCDYCEEMYSTHIRESSNGKIGFVCLNTAWRSIGKNDDNNLLFPLSKIDEALDRIINCDIKIAIHHHPLNDLKPYNLYQLEDLLHKRFHFMFSGHIHKNNVTMDLTPNDGVVKFGSSASLCFEENSQIGYSIVDIDYTDLKFHVNFRMYDQKNEIFYPIPQKTDKIPTSEIKKEQNKLRKNIRKRYLEELENSKYLFVESGKSNDRKNLLELSTNPVLKNKSLSEILNDDEQSHPDFVWSSFFEFNKDYIIFGKDKCGKTILLKKIELELLKDFSLHDYIPFYIDIRSWNNSNQDFNFEREFAKYYYINATIAKHLLKDKNIVLLIDNFHINNKDLKDKIEDYVTHYDNFKLVLCSVSSNALSSIDSSRFNGRVLSKLYFHRLRKIHIKALTKKNYNLPQEKEEQIVEKIDAIFKKLSIPFNYWTVSIFLWVFNKDSNNNLHNDVDLINLYIEKLLEKEQLTVSASTFTYNNYKKLLANLAYFLLKEHYLNSHYAKYSEIIDFIQKQLDKNPRKSTNPKEIFDYLDLKGLLRKAEPDMYSFRLNGVFEYFIAYYMTLDEDFLNSAVEDENYYLSFANEFELYAGFKRDNIDFLNKIYGKTKQNFSQLNFLYDLNENNLDSLLISKVKEADHLGKVLEKYSKKFQEGLTEIQQDEIEEQMINEMKLDESHSEVKKKIIKSFNDTAETLEDSLKILGKVFRNIDDIDDSNLVYEIFDYLIDNACLWGYKLIDEFGEMDLTKIIKEDVKGEAQGLIKLISSVIPTLVQVRLYDMIGHVNLEGIILNRLKISKENSKKNQFKLFIYTFLLLDINYNIHKKIVDDVMPLVRIPIIKYSFILKLNYYLGFKNTLSREDKSFLNNRIQSQYLKFNNKVDVGEVQKNLSKKNQKNPNL